MSTGIGTALSIGLLQRLRPTGPGSEVSLTVTRNSLVSTIHDLEQIC